MAMVGRAGGRVPPIRRRSTVDTGEVARGSQPRLSSKSTPSLLTVAAGSILQQRPESMGSSSETRLAQSEERPTIQMPKLPKASAWMRATSCVMVSRKHRLDFGEVKYITEQFEKVVSDSGFLNEQDFSKVLAKIFGKEDIKPAVVAKAYAAGFDNGMLDIDKFFGWYVQNMFTEVNAMNADADRQKSDVMVYKLAKHHGVDAVLIDKVKQHFDHFDTDGSGLIDYDEFKEMMRNVLKPKKAEDLNPERLHKFWIEIDTDGSGEVDFGEFLVWYLKYFHAENAGGEGFQSAKLLAAFYDSFNPTVQRGKDGKTVTAMEE